jgi:hypothetical protein
MIHLLLLQDILRKQSFHFLTLLLQNLQFSPVIYRNKNFVVDLHCLGVDRTSELCSINIIINIKMLEFEPTLP